MKLPAIILAVLVHASDTLLNNAVHNYHDFLSGFKPYHGIKVRTVGSPLYYLSFKSKALRSDARQRSEEVNISSYQPSAGNMGHQGICIHFIFTQRMNVYSKTNYSKGKLVELANTHVGLK